MARDIAKRLNQLRSRRTGVDRLVSLNETAKEEVIRRSTIEESWQKRTRKPYTSYALGATQEVGPEYTRISIESAERVGRQLHSNLGAIEIIAEFRLQGSVPLNVHIRGVSDVDLLLLDGSYFTYDTAGQLAQANRYVKSSKTSSEILARLRREAIPILKEKFPAAVVDASGGKAIAISGGSLQRPVDVVPSHWYDTLQFQATGAERDRAVVILDAKSGSTIKNWPFLHMAKLNTLDAVVEGAVKKAIRLCKNVKNDATEEGATINLPSFDIAALMYHVDSAAFSAAAKNELAVLAETHAFIASLAENHKAASELITPDGSRKILNTNEKITGLIRLSIELEDLVREVAAENKRSFENTPMDLGGIRKMLRGTIIPTF